MAEDEANPAPEEGLDQRVGRLEAGHESMTHKLDRILGLVGGGGHDDEATEDKGQGGAPNIAHEIRQQLDERDRQAREQADKDGLKSTVGELQTRLSELTEKPPAPLPRRIEKLMGWS
jgi:hypothetical protein